jgi:hypothetical protein
MIRRYIALGCIRATLPTLDLVRSKGRWPVMCCDSISFYTRRLVLLEKKKRVRYAILSPIMRLCNGHRYKKQSSSGKARTSNLLIATGVTVRRASQLRHRGFVEPIPLNAIRFLSEKN